jgi:hypothetical protein
MRPLLALLLTATFARAADRVPVLAELFTSEGCSSCPPADQLLQTLDRLQPVEGAQIVVLSLHVDYWDRLGWRDPFSSAAFSARQERYARALGGEVYTPQLVIDGRAQVLGNDPAAVRKAIAKAAAKPKPPMTVLAAREGAAAVVTVRFEAPGKARPELWIAIADESVVSPVARGENAGRTLAHVAVVRHLQTAGKISGTEKTLRLDVRPEPSRVIAFLTAGGGVLAAAMAPLP